MGQSFVFDGMAYRLIKGHKGPADIRLDWFVGGIWRTPGYRSLGLITDILGENEACVYRHGQGADYLVSYLDAAAFHGWQYAERGWNDRG